MTPEEVHKALRFGAHCKACGVVRWPASLPHEETECRAQQADRSKRWNDALNRLLGNPK
jgi:hypothetical protein